MRSKFKWIFTLVLALSMQFSFAQEKTVTGVVSDATGPIPGANVVIKATGKGTQTDIDGKYSISAKPGDVLEFSFVGMSDATATVGAANVYNATLQEGAIALSEVVVAGALGIRKRVDQQTSATTLVKAAEITQAAAPTVTQGLIGKVSGLQINTTNNGVNSATRIVINGPRSITGNNEALVVIDNANSTATVLNSLPPEIIENVVVLKGLQGAALYGEAGVNGVIIVTTKKGSGTQGKVTIDVSSSTDFQQVAYLPERQMRYGQGWFGEAIAIENGSWGAEMDGQLYPVGLPQADGTNIIRPYSPIEDNIKQFFQQGVIQQKGIAISAGTLADGYATLSVNRQDREFVVKDDELYRTNVMFKGGKQINRWFVEGNVQYYNQRQKNTTGTLYANLLQTATNIPVDQYSSGNNNHHWTVYYRSPYWDRNNIRFNTTTDFVNASGTLKYDFNDNISASYIGNVQLTTQGQENYTNAWTEEQDVYNAYSNRIVISNYNSSSSTRRNIYSDFLLNFNYMLTDDISFSANLGNNISDRYFKVNQVGGSQLDVDDFYNFSNVLQPTLASGLANNYARERRFSYFANVDFGYKNFLNLNLTGRNDWSSTLHPDNRSYFYPSVGLSFVPTKAFEGIKGTMNYMKLTASWTRVGNTSAVGAYDIDQTGVIPTGFPFGDTASYLANGNPTNELIEPEFVNTLDFGLNLGFFKDRLTLDAQYYIQKTENLITGVTASSASGIPRNTGNVGELETKGYNLDLGFIPFAGGPDRDGFRWEGKVNFSHYKSIVNKVSDDADEVNLQSNALIGIFAVEGEEFPTIKGIGYLRDPQGNIIVDPNSGQPVYTSEFIKLGKATPDYILGFTNSFSYKGFRFTAVCDYRTGHQFWSEVRSQLAWTGNLIESATNGRSGFIFPNSVYESAPGSGVYLPNTNIVTGGTAATGNPYEGYQTYFEDDHSFNNSENNVLDATAFKVRELALSYSIPKKLIERAGLANFTVGVNARNPFMILPKENRNYADPETSNTTGNAQGLALVSQYPYTRTFGFTINAKF